MELHKFFGTYANTPLAERGLVLDFIQHGNLTLNGIYKRLKEISDITRPYDIERDNLLRIADEYYHFKRK